MSYREIKDVFINGRCLKDILDNADNPVASTQQFDYDKYIKLHGAAEHSYIKKCDSVKSKILYQGQH